MKLVFHRATGLGGGAIAPDRSIFDITDEDRAKKLLKVGVRRVEKFDETNAVHRAIAEEAKKGGK